LLLLLLKKRLMLKPLPRFFSSGGASLGVLFLLVTLPFARLLAILVLLLLLLLLASLGRTGAFSMLSGFVAGERFSVPGVVMVRLGLSVVLRALVAEGVDGGSEGWGGTRLGDMVRRMEVSFVVFVGWLVGVEVSRWKLVVEGCWVVTMGFVGGGEAAVGGGLCEDLLLRKERRRMKGL
jgi:hypothetical protein